VGAASRETYPVSTRISANGTFSIPGKRLGRLVVGNAGATWTLSVQNLAGTVQVVITPVAGVYPIGWEYGMAGCQIVAAGTTPGDVQVLSE
jgi:hypothetical protein